MNDDNQTIGGDDRGGQETTAGEQEALDRLWAEFQHARASLAEVMPDDELRGLGFNLDVLDAWS